MLDLNRTFSNGFQILHASGRLDLAGAQSLQTAIEDAESSNIILDLSGVIFCASAGLRVIVTSAKTLRTKGGDMRIASLSPNVHQVFELSGLLSILSVYDSVPEAIKGG